jgi:hypothetical protein
LHTQLTPTKVALASVFALASALSAQAPPPPPPPTTPCAAVTGLQVVCGQQAPEDLIVLPGAQWVVAGAYIGTGGVHLIGVRDRKSTVAYPSASAKRRLDTKTYPACPGPPDAPAGAQFTTHGLYLQPGPNAVHKLFVVGHGSRESVEVFEVDARSGTPAFTWIGCVIAPDPIGLNSVRALPDGGFIATNFRARNSTPADRDRLMAGERNGELWEWHTASGWQKVPGGEASGANGIEISDDGRWYYVAAWGSQSFFRLSRGQGTPRRDEIPLGFRVDNIHWAQSGKLLAAGQGAQGTEIIEIDPTAMTVRSVARRPDDDSFRAGTVAAPVGNQLWVGSFLGDRIALLPAPR